MKKLFVLDASSYLYRSYFALQNMHNSEGKATNALFGFIRSILKLFKDFSPEHFVSVFDGPNGSKARKELFADYKAHRKAIPDDLRYQIEWAKEFCELASLCYLNIPEVEADDTMGSLAIWGKQEGFEVYLCTSDKDMCQLVNGSVFLLQTHKDNELIKREQVKEKYGVWPEQIIDFLAMTGDSSDNVPGVASFGPKTAADLLNTYSTIENIFAHLDEISPKKKQALVNAKDLIPISQKLVTLNTHVDFPKSNFSTSSFSQARLKDFFIKMNFHSLITKETEKKEDCLYTLVNDPKSLDELFVSLESAKQICFDTETTNEYPLLAALVGIGFSIQKKHSFYIPMNGNLDRETLIHRLKELFLNPNHFFFGHNVKYDLLVLQNEGIEIKNIGFDTLLASYLLNAHERKHSLDTLSLDLFGKVKTPISDLIGKGKTAITMDAVPLEKVSDYCGEGVDYTFRLKEVLEPQLQKEQVQELFYTMELPLMRVLAKMERAGIFLDKEALALMAEDVQEGLKKAQEKIFALAGETFNLNSPKQLSEVLFQKLQIPAPKKTATGLSTNAEVLELLEKSYPICSHILEYRTLEKLRSTYIETLPLQIHPKTGRIHCNFNQSVTATGRLSCQDPNLQNIPIRNPIGRKIRGAFRPMKEGWSFLSFDYSQIELRLLAHFSADKTLVDAFKNNLDIHSATAAQIFNVPLSQVTKEMRSSAKTVNFGVIYGQQAFGLAKELGISLAEAKHFIDHYFKTYPGVKEYIDSCKFEAMKTGKTTTATGRIRYLPDIHSKNQQLMQQAMRLAVNTPLQGTAADLIKLAMLAVDKILPSLTEGFMILQIHDELIFELPDSDIEKAIPVIKNLMETVWELKIPLVVDSAVGKNWEACYT